MNEVHTFKDVSEKQSNNSNGFREIKSKTNLSLDDARNSWDQEFKNIIKDFQESSYSDKNDINENKLIQNKIEGLRREGEIEHELKEKYPECDGYKVEAETYLRDKDGNIVKDPITGEARRIDFVVIKDEKVIDSIEVTSKTADKTEQSAKEQRIRDEGGNYIKDSNGNLVEIPSDVQTKIERRD